MTSKAPSSSTPAAASASAAIGLVNPDEDHKMTTTAENDKTHASAAASASSGVEDEEEEEEDPSKLYFRAHCQFVGLRYYDGVAHVGEYVQMNREPNNPYDRNAVRIDTMANEKFGHLKGTQAQKIAPIMDAMQNSEPYGLTHLDAFLAATPGYYNCRGDIDFYGVDLTQVPVLERILRSAGIYISLRNEDAPTSAGKKESSAGGGKGGSVSSRTVVVKDWRSQKELDGMFDKQKELLDAIPIVSPPSQLTTTLLPHQLKGLSWMLHRETGEHEAPFWTKTVEKGRTVWLSEITNASQPNKPISPKGGLLADEMGLGKTTQIISLILSNPPAGYTFKAGTDDEDKKPSAVAPLAESSDDEYLDVPTEAAIKKLKVGQLRSILKHSTESITVSGMKKGELVGAVSGGLEDGSIALKRYYSVAPSSSSSAVSTATPVRSIATNGVCCTTLVVCPVSVISNWIEQVAQHVKPGVLAVDIFQGTNRCRLLPLVQSNTIDILLVSYQTLAADYRKFFDKEGNPSGGKKRKSTDSALSIFDINFHRVVLDESHQIRNGKTSATKAVLKLQATYRFGLSGTPLQNRCEDIRPLLSFLRVDPLGREDVFRRAIGQLIRNGDEVGLARLRALLCHMAIRRTKAKEGIELTDRTVQVCSIKFPEDSVHKHIYDTLFTSAREAFAALLSAGDKEALSEYMSILETLLRIRQACCSGALVPRDRLERAERVVAELKKRKSHNAEPLTAAEGKELLEKLKGAFSAEANDSVECAVCLAEFSIDSAVILCTCSHIYCKACIAQVAALSSRKCPLCRSPFEETDMVEMAVASKAAITNDNDDGDDKKKKASISDYDEKDLLKAPKILALLKEIREIEDDSEKVIIFSQFTSFLDMVATALDTEGFSHTRIDGKMNTKRRVQAMTDFNSESPDSPRFILCSLLAAGTGINLTRGSRVFMMDLWWNRSVEDQAQDRCHRLGQKRDVKITKFVMEGSIEEQIIKMQDAKYALGKGTLEKLSADEMRTARIAALRDLFQISGEVAGSSDDN